MPLSYSRVALASKITTTSARLCMKERCIECDYGDCKESMCNLRLEVPDGPPKMEYFHLNASLDKNGTTTTTFIHLDQKSSSLQLLVTSERDTPVSIALTMTVKRFATSVKMEAAWRVSRRSNFDQVNYLLYQYYSARMGKIISHIPNRALRRNCANGVCIVCKDGECRYDNPIREWSDPGNRHILRIIKWLPAARRASVGSYQRTCIYGDCLECQNRHCKNISEDLLNNW